MKHMHHPSTKLIPIKPTHKPKPRIRPLKGFGDELSQRGSVAVNGDTQQWSKKVFLRLIKQN